MIEQKISKEHMNKLYQLKKNKKAETVVVFWVVIILVIVG